MPSIVMTRAIVATTRVVRATADSSIARVAPIALASSADLRLLAHTSRRNVREVSAGEESGGDGEPLAAAAMLR